jgi:hypothetical protein
MKYTDNNLKKDAIESIKGAQTFILVELIPVDGKERIRSFIRYENKKKYQTMISQISSQIKQKITI